MSYSLEENEGNPDNDIGYDSSSNSSSLSEHVERTSLGQTHVTRKDLKNIEDSNDKLGDHPVPHPTHLMFSPNEKGTKKQKRCDYDSDERSYDELGLEYKRRVLPTTARRDSFLPGKVKMVDFDHLGSKKLGNRILFEQLKDPDIDTLIDFATSYDKCYRKTEPTSLHRNIFHNSQRRNPLLSVSYDSPLPPSHIDYIKSRIGNQLPQQNYEEQSHQKSEGKHNQGRCIKVPIQDSAAVAMGMYLEECLTSSLLPLAGLHVLRCRALETMASAEIEFRAIPMASSGHKKKDNQQRQSGDDPASALHPTVNHPILGDQIHLDMNRQLHWKEDCSFQEWTLPPEEAILKLMEEEFLSNSVPYHFVPDTSRSWISSGQSADCLKTGHRHDERNSVLDPLGDCIGSLDDDSSSYTARWAKRYKVNPNVVSANTEIFNIFIPQNSTTTADELRKLPR